MKPIHKFIYHWQITQCFSFWRECSSFINSNLKNFPCPWVLLTSNWVISFHMVHGHCNDIFEITKKILWIVLNRKCTWFWIFSQCSVCTWYRVIAGALVNRKCYFAKSTFQSFIPHKRHIVRANTNIKIFHIKAVKKGTIFIRNE